jgi:hypothetical protein
VLGARIPRVGLARLTHRCRASAWMHEQPGQTEKDQSVGEKERARRGVLADMDLDDGADALGPR